MNEELQSTNEEPETSKEELQSVNEELSTVNHELAGKVDELQLGPVTASGGRCTTQGPPVEVRAGAALAIGLVLYELATNATKYGALSVASGHVRVEWDMEQHDGDRTFVLRWIERGGPEVLAPKRTGFGSELLNRQVRHELTGETAIAFNKEGVEVTLRAPARDTFVSAVAPASTASRAASVS